MAVNYGESGDGFADSLAKLRANAAAKENLIAKEAERTAAEERSTAAANENTVARTRTAQAAGQLVDTIGRSAEVVNNETAAVRANTAAWAANAAARGSTIGAAKGGSAGGVALPPVYPGQYADNAAAARYAGPAGGAAAATAGGAQLAAVAERNATALSLLEGRQAEVNDLLNRSAAAYAGSSSSLQRHGALTSEFIQGLARGEVTIKEFESQMVTTLGKFGGWAVAGGLVYGAFNAVKSVGDGITETESGIEQLKRSLGEGVDENKAAAGFRRVAQEVNVSIREVADAQFYAARAFQNQDESLAVASIALKAYKLDNVDTQEAIKTFGALNVAYGLDAAGVGEIFNILDIGQLKFNARLNQTLPQMGRAAASFHNAGGSAKELADQLIELNRATGGGGGTGGGNPATALIREPANLAKPATEATLRQYGFDPKSAQEHIGKFNEEVQKRAAISPGQKGALSDSDLRNLATAVGGGSALGLRYLLPLFNAGRTGLATAVPDATSKAAGSAQEDLNHKLAQFDEELHKLKVDFETFGSELASGGLGKSAGDVVNALNLAFEGANLLIQPFQLVGEAIGGLPGPLRLLAESLIAVKVAVALSRSQRGLTATAVGEQAGLTFLGGNAKDLLAVTATQREYVTRLQSLRSAAANSSITAGLRAQTAGGALDAFQAQAPGAGATQEEQVAYQQELATLNARFIAAKDAQLAASERLLAIENELTAKTALLNTLTDRKIAIETRLQAASAAGLYAAQRGLPNTLPLVAPTEEAAAAEAARTEGAATTGAAAAAAASGASGVGTAAEGAAPAVAAVTEESVASAGSLATVGEGLAGAAYAVRALPGRLLGFAGRLKGFIGGLGLLGKGLLAFVALQGADKLLGAEAQSQAISANLANLSQPAGSEADVIAKLNSARKTISGTRSFTGEFKSTIDELAKGFGLFGETTEEKVTKLEGEQDKLEKQRKKGAFRNLGVSGTLGNAELEQYTTNYESYIEGVIEGGKNAEKASTQLAAQNKLLADQIKLFGTTGGQGSQPLTELGVGVGLLGAKATVSQNPQALDEYSRFADEGLATVTALVSEEVKRANKTATTAAQREAIIAKARSTLSGYYANAYGKSSEIVREEVGDKHSELDHAVRELAKAKPGSSQAKKIDANKARIEAELRTREAALKSLGAASTTAAEKIEQQLEASLSEVFATESAEIKSKTKLGEARAGGNARAKESIGVKGLEEELKAARKLKGPEGENKIRELEAEVDNARTKQSTAGLDKVKRAAERAKASVGPGQSEQARADLLAAQDEARYIEQHAKDFGPEEVEKAQIAVTKAKRAVADALRSETDQLGKLHTQIAQAEAQGNASAQAAAAEAGAIEAASRAVTPVEKLQSQLDLVNARNQANQALQARVKAEGELAKSETTSPTKQAQIDVATAHKELGLAKGPDEKLSAQTDLNKAKQAQTQALLTNREREIKFHEEMREISKQDAIQQLEGLLRIHNLSEADREDLRSKIRALQQATSGNEAAFSLKPGQIKLPTVYDVRRAIGEQARLASNISIVDSRPQARSGSVGGPSTTHIANTNRISIVVQNAKDVARVGEEIERVTGAPLRGRLRAAGVR